MSHSARAPSWWTCKQGEVADAHPDQVSSDGFHPSTSGYAAIAALFATTLKRAP